jgi:hypothetical protein
MMFAIGWLLALVDDDEIFYFFGELINDDVSMIEVRASEVD